MQDFAKRAAAVCGKDVSELSKSFAGLQATQAPYFCLDLSFCHTVLTQGFDLSESAHITLVKQVGGQNGQRGEGDRVPVQGSQDSCCNMDDSSYSMQS